MAPSASSTAAKRIAREIKALEEPDSLPQGCKQVGGACVIAVVRRAGLTNWVRCLGAQGGAFG